MTTQFIETMEAEGLEESSDTSNTKETTRARILELFEQGVTDVMEIAEELETRPSYVAAVLRSAHHAESYFDLYTSTKHEMNAYSRHFVDKLRYRDIEVARDSVETIDEVFERYGEDGDRAGQHHAMVMAMVMANRARWSGKMDEARLFRDWLTARLDAFDEDLVEGVSEEE